MCARMIGLGFAIALAASSLPWQPADAETLRKNAEQPSEAWELIRDELYGARPVADAGARILLETPYRAHDAAIVPVAISLSPDVGETIEKMVLIVDENPMPVAAEFEFGPGMGRQVALSTRVRVNAYSNVRVIVEMADGQLFQAANYVKATGGCSAPALKDAEAALANVGKMKLRRFSLPATAGAMTEASPDLLHEAQLLVRHPNYSGFQVNQVTQLYIPAYFVDEMVVHQGDELVFRMTGGISLSEDPSIRFSYVPNGSPTLHVNIHDTDGDTYSREFPTSSEG